MLFLVHFRTCRLEILRDPHHGIKLLVNIKVCVYGANPADCDFSSLKHRPEGSEKSALGAVTSSPGRVINYLKMQWKLN